MDLLKDIQTALIIDDDADEIKELQEMLTKRGVYTRIFGPDDFVPDEPKTLKNHQLIFMDYMLIPGNEKANESKIRDILQKICHGDFGAYGLVLWTKHPEQIDLLKEKLTDDARAKAYITPLFVVGLDKTKYLRHGYASLKDDLNGELEKSKAAAFFFGWRQTVERGANKALKDIYELVPDYKKQERDFVYLLSKLALLYSGAPSSEVAYEGMTLDACRAINELLHYDVTTAQHDMIDVFGNDKIIPGSWELKEKASINGKLLVDDSEEGNSLPMPGKVYKVKDDISLLKIKDVPGVSEAIAIEVTPPCDLSQKKKVASRLIGGVMIEWPDDQDVLKDVKKLFNFDAFYKKHPICIKDKIYYLCLDFRRIYAISDEELTNSDKFEYLFTVKNRFFADILQKFSSHAARLGLAMAE